MKPSTDYERSPAFVAYREAREAWFKGLPKKWKRGLAHSCNGSDIELEVDFNFSSQAYMTCIHEAAHAVLMDWRGEVQTVHIDYSEDMGMGMGMSGKCIPVPGYQAQHDELIQGALAGYAAQRIACEKFPWLKPFARDRATELESIDYEHARKYIQQRKELHERHYAEPYQYCDIEGWEQETRDAIDLDWEAIEAVANELYSRWVAALWAARTPGGPEFVEGEPCAVMTGEEVRQIVNRFDAHCERLAS